MSARHDPDWALIIPALSARLRHSNVNELGWAAHYILANGYKTDKSER